MSYQYQPLTSKTFPTITQTLAAVKKADKTEDTERDVRDLMSVLVRATVATPRLAGHILTRRTALSSFNWDVKTKDPDKEELKDRAKRRTAAVVRKVLQSHTDVPMFGVMGMALEWVADPELGLVPKVTKRHRPTELDKVEDRVVVLDETTGKAIGDHAAQMAEDAEFIGDVDGTTERGGILRTIVFHCILHHETVIEWSRLNKRMKGVVSGVLDARKIRESQDILGLSDDQVAAQISALDETLAAAGENNYLKVLSGIDIQLKSLVEGNAGNSYAQFIDNLRTDISVAVLGQANTTQLPNAGGSRAALQVLNLIRDDITFADMERVEDLVNALLLWDYRKNVDPAAVTVPWSFGFVFDDNEDVETNARVFESVSRIGGVTVSRSEFYTKLGLSEPDAENPEDVMVLGNNATAPGL